jgi:hypothetical protein
MAAFAEHEAELISARAKAALAVVKAAITADGGWTARKSGRRIIRLGNPALCNGARIGDARHARRARTEKAAQFAADALPYIAAARRTGCTSLGEIGAALTARGIETPSGCQGWSRIQVSRILARAPKA